jgi:hypothetical protein
MVSKLVTYPQLLPLGAAAPGLPALLLLRPARS